MVEVVVKAEHLVKALVSVRAVKRVLDSMNVQAITEFMETSIKESIDMDANQFNFSYTGAPLSEAQFDFEHRSGVLTVITKGWSKNDFYYTDKALEDINSFLNTTAERFFANHNDKKELFKPRLVEDLLGEVQEAWIAENAVKAKVKFYENVGKPFIIGLLKEAPDKVGPSIVGKAVVRDGEIDGRKGKIVERVSYLHAFEIVAQPSAGGKVDVIYETTTVEEKEDEIELEESKYKNMIQAKEAVRTAIRQGKLKHPTKLVCAYCGKPAEEYHHYKGYDKKHWLSVKAVCKVCHAKYRRDAVKLIKAEEDVSELTDLKGKIRKSKEEKEQWNKWWDTKYIVDSMICDMIFAQNDYMFTVVEDRKKLVKEALLQFEVEILKFKFAEPKEKSEEASEGYRVTDSDKAIQIKLYPANAFKQGSISSITNSAKGIIQKIGKLKKSGKLAVHSFVFNKDKGWIMATVTNWLSNNKIEPTKEGVDMEIEIKNLADLKALDSTLYDSLVMEATTTEEHKEKVKKLEQDSQKLFEVEERVVTLEKETTELKEAKEKAEKERDALQAEADTFEVERTGMKKKEIISKLKKDAKLSEEYCSEVFDQELKAFAFETEEKFSEAIKAKIEDRVALVTKVNPDDPVIKGAGHPQKKDEKKDVAETKYPFSNEDMAKELKKSN